MSAALTSFVEALRTFASDEQAQVLRRFFKTGKGDYGEGDCFLGIKVPHVRSVVKRLGGGLSIADVKRLIHSRYHEERLAGLLVLCKRYCTARSEAEQKKMVELYQGHYPFINNWDLVDLTCPTIIGDWYFTHAKAYLFELARQGRTIWEKRIAIVSTLTFIRRGDLSTTLELAQILMGEEHDLLHKAVGWLLREVGKRDEARLKAFLVVNGPRLSRTTLRAAIERFPIAQRQYYLKSIKKI